MIRLHYWTACTLDAVTFAVVRVLDTLGWMRND